MSADSPRKITRNRAMGLAVLPQPVTDPSLIDSVAGFIQEVVPQAYGGTTTDSREVITWARVHQSDINDPALYPDTGEVDGVPPLLLMLGYGSGVQVWLVPVTGEAREVLSWSQSTVRNLCVLPTPEVRLLLTQDHYKHKRPLVAICDNAGPGPPFCAVSFISLRDGDQVKNIKFSHQVSDVLANRRSVVISLVQRIAVFDAATLEEKLVVTNCYPSPETNPVALGTRWLAYADRRLVGRCRSQGGCHSEGPQSVTATVFHAAKFLGKGLRDLSETVASSLTGCSLGSSPENTSQHQAQTSEPCLKGIVTILDIDMKLPNDVDEEDHQEGPSRVVAHFNAHFEPIVALNFDPSGMLLLTADKHGHRFHVFRINPHPSGPVLAHVQHLYILHRGDTTARIQDITFSADSRWVAISSMRGTTHVFPITPYGGPVGVRTHTSPQVVNKLSRFHRSAGLTDEGRNSPVLWEGPPPSQPAISIPTTVTALAQVRRQTIVPPTEDSIVRVAACFGAPRAPSLAHHSRTRRAMDSLYVVGSNGTLIQYDMEPQHFSGVNKEKVCDDTSIELHVEAKAEWVLQRPPYSNSLHPPLVCTNPLLSLPDPPIHTNFQTDEEHWLSQVEIVTHAGPHRRLWMGPQFTFITVNSDNEPGDVLDINNQAVCSSPVNMPPKQQPLIIEAGSCSSLDMSPNMVELVYKTDCSLGCRLREDLAEAMLESPTGKSTGVKGAVRREPVIERQVNPLGSVVTLTAQLNFPANLLAKDGRVSVVGTETKKITLESRFNKPLMKMLLSECLLSENLDSYSKLNFTENTDSDTSNIDLDEKVFKIKQKTCENHLKSCNNFSAEVDENFSNPSKKFEEKEDIPERRSKSGKSRRKISKGEKIKSKPDVELKESECSKTLPTQESVSQIEMDIPVDGMLRGSSDIEMQLREASLEKIYLETEDFKGRKRSLDITLKSKASNLSDKLIFVEADKFVGTDLQESDKISSRQCKKSRINEQDAWLNKNLSDDSITNGAVVQFGSKEISNVSKLLENSSTVEEKPKSKKKKSRKGSLNEYPTDNVQVDIEKSTDLKKVDDFNIELSMLEVSQETNCSEMVQNPLYFEIQLNRNGQDQKGSQEIQFSAILPEVSVNNGSIDNEIVDINYVEEKNCTTDDELKGFESDLLVKDSNTWSSEKSPERDLDILMDDKDSDKEVDKVKNDETTDKDSSDDCQPVVIKPDTTRQVQKRGKNRKIIRKIRELETKILDSEIRYDEKLSLEDVKLLETVSAKNSVEKRASLPKDDIGINLKKVESVEKTQIVETKNKQADRFLDDIFPELKVSKDGVKRICTKEPLEKEIVSSISSKLDIEVPKRSWSSIVSSNCEDLNGNVSKHDENVAPLRSWSNVAAGPVKPKVQDAETTKTSSVEDRDSVYESCNDSVGEEIEPTLDSLSSCYFEPETKNDIVDPGAVSEYKKEVASSESKSGSSVEDKSNTDSGEKEDVIVGMQTTIKKSKKQRKKRR